jgi:hypothetical protein
MTKKPAHRASSRKKSNTDAKSVGDKTATELDAYDLQEVTGGASFAVDWIDSPVRTLPVLVRPFTVSPSFSGLNWNLRLPLRGIDDGGFLRGTK